MLPVLSEKSFPDFGLQDSKEKKRRTTTHDWKKKTKENVYECQGPVHFMVFLWF